MQPNDDSQREEGHDDGARTEYAQSRKRRREEQGPSESSRAQVDKRSSNVLESSPEKRGEKAAVSNAELIALVHRQYLQERGKLIWLFAWFCLSRTLGCLTPPPATVLTEALIRNIEGEKDHSREETHSHAVGGAAIQPTHYVGQSAAGLYGTLRQMQLPSHHPSAMLSLLQQQGLVAHVPPISGLRVTSISPLLSQATSGSSTSILPSVLQSLQHQRLLSLLQGQPTFPVVRQPGQQQQLYQRFIPIRKDWNQLRSSTASVSSSSNSAATSMAMPNSHGAQSSPNLPAVLAQVEDQMKLSPQQVFLRHQIEVFCAGEDDVSTHTRGRNKPITLGQVGIRCRHCAHLPISRRQKGSTYFPASLQGIYQAAQNMSTTHMQCGLCSEMPDFIKNEFARLLVTKVSRPGAGRVYWAESAKKLGLINTEEGIRFVDNLDSRR